MIDPRQGVFIVMDSQILIGDAAHPIVGELSPAPCGIRGSQFLVQFVGFFKVLGGKCRSAEVQLATAHSIREKGEVSV